MEAFGRTSEGQAVGLYTLANANGLIVRFIAYGGAVTAIEAPDRDGRRRNVVLALPDLESYEQRSPRMGALIGRFANRIGGASFRLDGQVYRLAANNGPNSLHGGRRGFDKAVWTVEPAAGGTSAVLTYQSADGEEGYPGALSIRVTYTVTPDDAFRIDYEATTTRPTILNPTSHCYFNLAGEGAGNVYGHVVEIEADAYTPIDAGGIPTGEIAPVAETPFDFRKPAAIGTHIRSGDAQMRLGLGYDHNFVLKGPVGELRRAARVREPLSGRVMQMETTEPGLQLYTANRLDGSLAGPAGTTYRQGDGLCLEAQHFPDGPNKPGFPSTALRPGETFRSTTLHRFTTDTA